MIDVILDITELVGNPIRTGIQRVVRELIRHWPNPEELTLARFESGRGLVPISRSLVPMLVDADSEARDAEPERLQRLIATRLGEPAPPLPNHASVLVPEVFYDRERCRWYRELLRCDPKAASFLIYDMIPWLYPDRIGVRSTAPLMPYLQLVRDARRTAFISAKTRSDYERIRGCAADCGPVIPLGADGLSLEPQSFRSNWRTWVTIGSIDGRKNQENIVGAFRELWGKGFDGELVLIGRVFESASSAWLRDALKDPRLRHLADVADEVVRAELRRARATIYVSEVEGFGLPPVESLYAGVPVIVSSSVPSIVDLPHDGQVRLPSADVRGLVDAIRITGDDETAIKLWEEARLLQLTTWRDFANQVLMWVGGTNVQGGVDGKALKKSRFFSSAEAEVCIGDTQMQPQDMYNWWNTAAHDNAMYAILSNKQDWDENEFFETGRAWLEQHRQFARAANVDLAGESALDFGCGIGRMTRALADHYSKVFGIDISDEMVRRANTLERTKNITFRQVVEPSLPFADRSIELVYSTIVVQHIPSPHNITYLNEFFRVSRDLVMFDAPSHIVNGHDLKPSDGIFLLPWRTVLAIAGDHGFELVALRDFPATPTRHYQYLFKAIPNALHSSQKPAPIASSAR